MGKIFKRSDSKYYYADYRNAEGKRIKACLWTSDRKAALKRLRDAELGNGPCDAEPDDQGPSLVTALDWVINSDLKPPTRKMYTQKARNLVRLLGAQTPLADLDRQVVRGYIDERLTEIVADEKRDEDGAVIREQRTVSRSTVHKELITLRKALHEAAERHRGMPAIHDVIPRFSAEYQPRDRWLTPDDVARLLAELPDERKPWVQIAVYYSPNFGELASLRPEHIEDAHLHIPGTKRTARDRRVPEAPRLPLRQVAAMVPVRPWQNMRRDMAVACRHAGIEPCTSNDLRRTFASWLIQAGTPLKVVAKLMGHATTVMVDRVYGHLSDKQLVEAMATQPEVRARLKVVK